VHVHARPWLARTLGHTICDLRPGQARPSDLTGVNFAGKASANPGAAKVATAVLVNISPNTIWQQQFMRDAGCGIVASLCSKQRFLATVLQVRAVIRETTIFCPQWVRRFGVCPMLGINWFFAQLDGAICEVGFARPKRTLYMLPVHVETLRVGIRLGLVAVLDRVQR
jgi:hypothetical protein